MYSDELPERIPGTHDSIYGGFGIRLGSLLLDGLFCLPVSALVLYLQSFGRDAYLLSAFPLLIFSLWYGVYLPARYGGTPGKQVIGLTILKINGEPIGMKEAFMRNIVSFGISLFSMGIMTIALSKIDNEYYSSLNWLDRSRYLMTLVPLGFTLHSWMSNVWFVSELIVLLTNKQRRAIHDFIAGTVIVKTEYLGLIQAYLNPATPPEDDQQGDSTIQSA